MSKEMAVIAFGIWVIATPYLGVPGSWRTVLLVLTGIALVCLGFFLRAEMLSRGGRRGSHHPFVENASGEDAPHTAYHYHEQRQESTKVG